MEGGTGKEVRGGRYGEGGTGREVRGGRYGREVWGGGTSGKVWRGVATITLFVCYLCIAKVEVDGCGMANMEHAIWFRRESSHHLDWTNRVTEL